MYTLEETHMTQFVVYRSPDEIIVTTGDEEQEMLRDYPDRDFGADYDRMAVEGSSVSVTARLRWD